MEGCREQIMKTQKGKSERSCSTVVWFLDYTALRKQVGKGRNHSSSRSSEERGRRVLSKWVRSSIFDCKTTVARREGAKSWNEEQGSEKGVRQRGISKKLLGLVLPGSEKGAEASRVERAAVTNRVPLRRPTLLAKGPARTAAPPGDLWEALFLGGSARPPRRTSEVQRPRPRWHSPHCHAAPAPDWPHDKGVPGCRQPALRGDGSWGRRRGPQTQRAPQRAQRRAWQLWLQQEDAAHGQRQEARVRGAAPQCHGDQGAAAARTDAFPSPRLFRARRALMLTQVLRQKGAPRAPQREGRRAVPRRSGWGALGSVRVPALRCCDPGGGATTAVVPVRALHPLPGTLTVSPDRGMGTHLLSQ